MENLENEFHGKKIKLIDEYDLVIWKIGSIPMKEAFIHELKYTGKPPRKVRRSLEGMEKEMQTISIGKPR